MRIVERYVKATSLEEALAAKRADPAAAFLAGGTFLLAGDYRDKPASVVDIGEVLPKGIEAWAGALVIGAGATFQDLISSPVMPAILKDAALGMVNRNTRNRATVGGNIGANKSCASLLPALLVLRAELEVSDLAASRASAEEWLGSPSGIVTRLRIEREPSRREAYLRWSRSACDISVLTAAVSYNLSDGRPSGLRIAMGGLGPKARRFPELEKLIEGRILPSREEIERAVAPLLNPRDDLRASAAFKRLRGAALLADALHAASAEAPRAAGHREAAS